MVKAILLTILLVCILSSPSYALHSEDVTHFVKIGIFANEPDETCRPESGVIAAPGEIDICLWDGVVILDNGKYVEFEYPELIPVSIDLTGYHEYARATFAVERSIDIYSVRLKDTFRRHLERSGRYIEMMKEILREEGIPEDIAYLPLVESGFNVRAYSRSRAAGPWQFISATGKRYGLRVDWWIDERRDPVKSTHAAARYLRDLHEMFGSWSLAMASYNAGEGKIRRALKRTKSKDYWGLLATRRIKRETKNYVPNFIAARQIALNPEAFGFDNVAYQEPFAFDEVSLESPLTLDIIAKCAETTVSEIKTYNPELRRWSTPPDMSGYVLKIPPGMKDRFLANLAKIPEGKRFTVRVYRVKRGDTVSQIAHKTGVPSRVIIAYNKLNRRGFITVGQRLLVPIGLRRN